ncbi:T9SS type A sorting domain-containing protein [Dokdonia ponticola]|uniref:T9SS type A sorting domain-containing protein n=1 Tax=Dokdonia ponticola TaxID=2041041 RepID=A0ABV9HYW9_9FLAO
MTIYRFFLVLLCFVVSQNSFAQDPILFEGVWELESITIDGEEFFPPSNEEVDSVDLIFEEANNGNPDMIIGSVCDAFSASVTFQEADGSFPSFMIGDDYVTTLANCDTSENQNFQNIYFAFYETSLSDPFEYSLEFLGNNPALIITSSNGYVAIYGNPILSLNGFNKPSFSIYPNPAQDQLFIDTHKISEAYTITIFDVQGKQLVQTSEKSFEVTPIQIQNWASGVYFVRLESQNGVMTTQRFIKK